MTDSPPLRGRILRNLLRWPLVNVPAVLGTGALLLGLATGRPTGYLAMLGAAGVLAGAAAAVGRWWMGSDELARLARQQLQDEGRREHRTYLRRLYRRLRKDRDRRTNKRLKQLQRIHGRLQRAGVLGRRDKADLQQDIKDDAAELYGSCVTSLERSLDLWHAAKEMASAESRDRLLAAREELLEEVGHSIAHLDATLDHLNTSKLKPGARSEQLARTREELEIGLQVARRVEQRMAELEVVGPVGAAQGRDAAL